MNSLPSRPSPVSSMAISDWIGSVSWNSSISTYRNRSKKCSLACSFDSSSFRAQTSRSWNSAPALLPSQPHVVQDKAT